jgi:hypothetical protein
MVAHSGVSCTSPDFWPWMRWASELMATFGSYPSASCPPSIRTR